MKQLLIAAFLLVCVTAPAFAAADHDLERQLNQQYVGKTLILRHPVEKDSQQYDSAGKLLSGGHEGAWTLYGGVVVRNVGLGQDQLRIEGDRAWFSYDAGQGALVPSHGDGQVKVDIHLDQPCASREEADAIVSRVFAVTDRDLYDSLPDYWKPYMAKRAAQKMGHQPSDGPAFDTTGRHARNSAALPDAGHDLSKLSNIVTVTEGVTPPKAQHTPEPGYTHQAQKKNLQGAVRLEAVIDESGRVVFPRIVRPLGLGLDEKAIEDVTKWWKFKAARQNGKPVKVELDLEIDFRLF